MNQLGIISQPVADDLLRYKQLFDETLTHEDDYLGQALAYVRMRKGKMMRPILVLLVAKELGDVRIESLRSAVTLELLHTASLVHDDVVDESDERRGQPSTNSVFGNKVAVLVGDYLLSKSLHLSALTGNIACVDIIAQLGGTLSEGEVFQLANIRNEKSTEEAYYRIIHNKTAVLFSACAELGALSAGGDSDFVAHAKKFGELVGMCFQIRDDIFDYYNDSAIGKPTGNDMAEGKLTLPAIYALEHTDQADIRELAAKIKRGEATREDINKMVDFTKHSGGIEYARRMMDKFHDEALEHLCVFKKAEIKASLKAYLDFVIGRDL